MTTLEHYRQDFILHLKSERGLSPNTVEAYGRDVGYFVAHLGAKSILEVVPEDAVRFISSMKEQAYASSSLYRTLIAIKVFFRFLKQPAFYPKMILTLLWICRTTAPATFFLFSAERECARAIKTGNGLSF